MLFFTTNTGRKQSLHHIAQAKRELKAVVHGLNKNYPAVPRQAIPAMRSLRQAVAQLDSLKIAIEQEMK